MQSPTEPTPNGSTARSLNPSSDEPAAFQARSDKRIEYARKGMTEALEEAKRRGVPLHEIIPVH